MEPDAASQEVEGLMFTLMPSHAPSLCHRKRRQGATAA